MRRAALVTALLPGALLVLPACSSSNDTRPAYRVPALIKLLVTARDVDLQGYTTTRPDGEEQPGAATATAYFNRAGFTDSGLHSSDVASQVTVTLVATSSPVAARARVDDAVASATAGLRDAPTSTPVGLGTHGREVAGRAKGDGAAQRGVYFADGEVAVSVIVSSVVAQPATIARDVARAQDAKLRRSS
ncbi:hypothetical protein [uncultured Jatrophihabitans sp.]|uniref:hypothetical protein n=1 Tax=uncultured Jatrophihabitans sp. TaxID=1610747 RepID=UPI0035CC542C